LFWWLSSLLRGFCQHISPLLSRECMEESGRMGKYRDRCGDPWNDEGLFLFYLYTFLYHESGFRGQLTRQWKLNSIISSLLSAKMPREFLSLHTCRCATHFPTLTFLTAPFLLRIDLRGLCFPGLGWALYRPGLTHRRASI